MTPAYENPQDSFEEIVDALQALPHAETVVWGDDAYVFHPDARRCSFVDVYTPSICDPLGLNWSWTIVSTSTDEDGPVWTPGSTVRSTMIEVAPDATVWSVRHPDFTLEDVTAHMIVCTGGNVPTREQHLQLEDVAARTGGEVFHEDAWTFTKLSETLTQWSACHAGREDLRFVVDLELTSPILDELNAIMEADAASDEPDGYEIGTGVRASSHALDQLLAMDPDDAAFITTLMGQIAERHFGPEGETPENSTEEE